MRILSISTTIVAEIAQSQETCKHLVQVEKKNPMKGKGIMPENRQKHKQLIAVGGMQLKTNLGGSRRALSHETDQGLHTIIKIIKQDKINTCDSRLEAKLFSCSASSPKGFLPTHYLSVVLSFVTFIGSICLVPALSVDGWQWSTDTENLSCAFFRQFNKWTGAGYVPDFGFLSQFATWDKLN